MSSISASLFSGVFFNWEEYKPEGSLNVHVVCKDSGENWNIGDSPNVLRLKFLGMATVANALSIMAVVGRIVRIFKGSFIEHAKLRAKHEWINSLDSEKEDYADRLKNRFYKAILPELYKEVAKTLVMAVCIPILIAIAIFGIVFPYDARKLVSDLTKGYAPLRFNQWAFYPLCMTDASYRERETLHALNKSKPAICSYRQKTQKARIIFNYKPYFEAKKIDCNNLKYAELRKIINQAKHRFDETETELKLFLEQHGETRDPKNIQVLNLSFKDLKRLPASFKLLENLKELDLSDNKLTKEALDILKHLKKLTHVRLSYNQLNSIYLNDFPVGCTVNLDNNPIKQETVSSLLAITKHQDYKGPQLRFS